MAHTLGTVTRRDRHRSHHRRRPRRRARHASATTAGCSTPGTCSPSSATSRDAGTEAVSPGAIEDATGVSADRVVGRDEVRHVVVQGVVTTIADLQAPPVDTHDVYLRLHLLSHRLVRPNTINLEGIFGLLETVAWTQLGPVAVDELPAAQLRARAAGTPLVVRSLDKFPPMLDYVAPVRGAHRRRQPGAPRCPPRRGHHRHARGLRELQRRHPRHRDGGGPHQPGRRDGRGLRPRRWRVDAWARCRGAARSSCASASGAWSAPTAASASPSATTAWWRPGSTSPRAPGSRCPTARS